MCSCLRTAIFYLLASEDNVCACYRSIYLVGFKIYIQDIQFELRWKSTPQRDRFIFHKIYDKCAESFNDLDLILSYFEIELINGKR